MPAWAPRFQFTINNVNEVIFALNPLLSYGSSLTFDIVYLWKPSKIEIGNHHFNPYYQSVLCCVTKAWHMSRARTNPWLRACEIIWRRYLTWPMSLISRRMWKIIGARSIWHMATNLWWSHQWRFNNSRASRLSAEVTDVIKAGNNNIIANFKFDAHRREVK